MDRFWNKVNTSTGGCWQWQAGVDDAGYGQFRFEGKNIKAHRVSFFLHYGTWPDVCRHICDNPSCVNPQHLSDGTSKDNSGDMYSRERNSGLTRSQVEEIRQIPMSPTIVRDVAERYGITEQSARSVISGSTWSYLPGARRIIRQKSRSKLSIEDIIAIKIALQTPYWGQVKQLAAKYGVTHSEISHIKSGYIHADVSINDI